MNYFLIKEDDNYADEFDIEGFKIEKSKLSIEDYKKNLLLEVLMERGDYDEDDNEIPGKFPLEFYFGTNEAIEIRDEKDFWRVVSVEPISKAEYDTLKKLFPTSVDYAFGTTAII